MCQRTRDGFTLVELLVVIAIIGILIGLLMPALSGARESSYNNTCKNNLGQFGKAAMAHDVSRGRLPKYWDDGLLNHEGSTGVKGNWYVQMLPFLDQSGVHEEVSASGSGVKIVTISPKVPASPDYKAGQTERYEPATKTIDDPACMASRQKVYDPIPENGGIQKIPGYEYEFPAPAQSYHWEPESCPKVTIPNPLYPRYYPPITGQGTPEKPAVTKIVYLGVDSITGIVQAPLICPSDPTTADGYLAPWPSNWGVTSESWKKGLPYAVSNYHANWHAFSPVRGDARPQEMPANPKGYDPLSSANKQRANPAYFYSGCNVPPSSLSRISDGTSNTILFAEAYAKCTLSTMTFYRFAVWGESHRNTDQKKVDYAYPATNFGTNHDMHKPLDESIGPYAVTPANTYMFQKMPGRSRCDFARIQSIHSAGLNVCMADGSVRTLSPDISHLDKSNVLTEPDASKWTAPVPRNMIAAKYDADGSPLAVVEYGVWDLLMLPRDSQTINEDY